MRERERVTETRVSQREKASMNMNYHANAHRCSGPKWFSPNLPFEICQFRDHSLCSGWNISMSQIINGYFTRLLNEICTIRNAPYFLTYCDTEAKQSKCLSIMGFIEAVSYYVHLEIIILVSVWKDTALLLAYFQEMAQKQLIKIVIIFIEIPHFQSFKAIRTQWNWIYTMLWKHIYSHLLLLFSD